MAHDGRRGSYLPTDFDGVHSDTLDLNELCCSNISSFCLDFCVFWDPVDLF